MSVKQNAMATRPLMQEIFASRLYKRNQGKMVRQITAIAMFLVAVVSAWRAHALFIAPAVIFLLVVMVYPLANVFVTSFTQIDTRERIIVGVNGYLVDESTAIPILEMDPRGYDRQVGRLQRLRAQRDNAAVHRALAALAAGKHVIVEKPISLETGDAQRMAKKARDAGKLLMVAHVLPFFPEYAFAREAVQSGKYGKLLGGHFKRVISDPTWIKDFYDPRGTGGPVVDLHIHDAHFIRLLCGMPKTVFSGTAIATVSIVILKAWTASGFVIWLKTSPMPSSNVLIRATPIGSNSRTVR